MTVRRARPLLGTLVEIRARGPAGSQFDGAADRAFEAVAEVHRLMSFHDPASDVSRIARATSGQRLRVHPRTATVLRRALHWARASGGAFDASCGAGAVSAGWLPAPARAARPATRPLGECLDLHGREVCVRHPVWPDLGGIAKGYAVDRAVATLRRGGLRGGIVNAGGDLRVFGPDPESIHVRSPDDPSRGWPVAALREGACATSASGQVVWRGQAAAAGPRSVTVFAATACTADALTKVVWLLGRASAALLQRARAHAFVVEGDGSTWRI